MLERIWNQNRAILRSIACSVLLDPSSVDDILQDTFAKLLRCERRFASEQEAFNYIRRAVLNTSIDYLRSSRRRSRRLLHSPAILSTACQPDANPLCILARREEERLKRSVIEEIRKILGGLPPQQREAIDILFNRNHEKIKDICHRKGIPYTTLRSRALAAIERIRSRLKSNGLFQKFKEAHEK